MNVTNSIEGFAMLNYKKGKFFYSAKSQKDITALANYYQRKVKTEIFTTIDCKVLKQIGRITKVTFLQ